MKKLLFFDTIRKRDEMLDTIDRLQRDLQEALADRDELEILNENLRRESRRQAEQIDVMRHLLRDCLPVMERELTGGPDDAATLSMILSAIGEEPDHGYGG